MGKHPVTKAIPPGVKSPAKTRKRKNTVTLTNNKDKKIPKEYDEQTGMEISNQYGNLSDCVFEDDEVEVYNTNHHTSPNNPSSKDLPKPTTMLSQKNNLKPINNEETSTKTKPITIDNASIQIIKNLMSSMTLESNHLIKMITSRKIQIFCFSYKDKTKVIEKLKEQKLQYFSYSEKQDKAQVYVLKKHHHVTTEALLTTLKDHKIPATKVSFLNKDENNPSYLVHFERNVISFFTLSQQNSTLDNLIIKWEKFNKTKKKVTQCHRCQEYGHSAINCGKSYRCIKCIHTHLPGECLRTTREGNPKCVNCNEDHAANSKNCEFFKNYKQKISSFKKPINRRTFISTPAPWASPNLDHNYTNKKLSYTQDHFPTLPTPKCNLNGNASVVNAQSYQNSVKKPHSPQNSTNFSDFEDIRKGFYNIPDIATTLRLYWELVGKLNSTSDHGARLGLMMQYCTPQNVN